MQSKENKLKDTYLGIDALDCVLLTLVIDCAIICITKAIHKLYFKSIKI